MTSLVEDHDNNQEQGEIKTFIDHIILSIINKFDNIETLIHILSMGEGPNQPIGDLKYMILEYLKDLNDPKTMAAIQMTAKITNTNFIKRALYIARQLRLMRKKYRGRNISRLIRAVENDNTHDVKILLLDPETDVNQRHPRKNARTALHLAMQVKNSKKIVKMLLKVKNININLQDRLGYTALYLAIFNWKHSSTFKLLKQSHIRVNVPTYQQRWTALHCAAFEGNAIGLWLLIKFTCVDVNIRDIEGCTALHCAADQCHLDCVKILLYFSNINKNILNNEGMIAMFPEHCMLNTCDRTLMAEDPRLDPEFEQRRSDFAEYLKEKYEYIRENMSNDTARKIQLLRQQYKQERRRRKERFQEWVRSVHRAKKNGYMEEIRRKIREKQRYNAAREEYERRQRETLEQWRARPENSMTVYGKSARARGDDEHKYNMKIKLNF